MQFCYLILSKDTGLRMETAAALPTTPATISNGSYYSKCYIYSMKTDAFMVFRGYEGTIENFIINIGGFFTILLLFGILRKRAWNYRRSALVQRTDPTWIQLFYGEPQNFTDTSSESVQSESEDIGMQHNTEKGCCSWIKAIFKVKDADILKRCGKDAMQYLSFQRHIIIYMVIICILSLVIVLPVNLHGELELSEKFFGRTTLSNLDPQSNLLWVHVAFAFFFLPLGIFFMRHFSANLSAVEQDANVSRTLMVCGIPEGHCTKANINRHFREAYPECIVQDIQFAYDVRLLTKLEKQRKNASRARTWCETVYSETGVRPRMRPYICGRMCCCCPSVCRNVDALEYYGEEEQALATAVDRERSVSLQKPLGLAYVTFQTEHMADVVYKDFASQCRCISNPPSSSVSRQLYPHDWLVTYAPLPNDILWNNLAVNRTSHWFRSFIVNLLLFLLLFFVTTPVILFDNLDLIYFVEKAKTYLHSSILSGFIPTFLLWSVSILLPFLVTYSDEFLSHWTRSKYNYSIMCKTFTFLLFMIVILPSLGLTSAKGLVDWAVLKPNETYRWQCLFLSDNGALFVKYVNTAGFVGCSLELIRFPELFVYFLYLCFSRSEAENGNVRRAVMWEFAFGVHYAWYLLIFALTMIYSLSCPLIVPFGLLYLTFKHCVDRHNVYFVYSPSKISPTIHATAINIVVISLILQQMFLFFFSFVRTGWSNLSIVSLTIFVVTLMVFFAQVSLSMFQQFSPIIYKRFTRRMELNGKTHDSHSASDDKTFLPDVLKQDGGIGPGGVSEFYGAAGPTFANKGRHYGTSEDSVPSSPTRNGDILGQDIEEGITGESPAREGEENYQRY